MMFGRSTLANTLALSLLTSAVNGRPFCKRQDAGNRPPAGNRTREFVPAQVLPARPKGNSQTGLMTSLLRISKPERPRSRRKFVGSAADEREGVTLYGVPGVSSIDLPCM